MPPGDDADPVGVSRNQVAGLHPNPAAEDGTVDIPLFLFDRPPGHEAPAVHREVQPDVPVPVPGVAVHHHPGKTGGLAGPHDKVAEVGAAVIALAVDDHDIAIRLEGVAGQVDGKVVPLPGLHRQGGAGHRHAPVYRQDAGVHTAAARDIQPSGLYAVQQQGDAEFFDPEDDLLREKGSAGMQHM